MELYKRGYKARTLAKLGKHEEAWAEAETGQSAAVRRSRTTSKPNLPRSIRAAMGVLVLRSA